jgi:hypothetical protein
MPVNPSGGSGGFTNHRFLAAARLPLTFGWSYLMPFEDDPGEFDYRDDDDDEVLLSPEVHSIVDHLRETLTYDMAGQMIRNRFGVTPKDDAELEQLMEELIADAFNDGYDSWDSFPY